MRCGDTKQIKKHENKSTRCLTLCPVKDKIQISVVRFLVFFSLFVAAIACAAVSYFVLHSTEQDNYEDGYYAVTGQMTQSVEDFLNKYHATSQQLAVIANIRYPNASSWPFVGISDFHLLDESIINVTGSASGNSILPIVTTDKLNEFNAYARDFLAGEDFISQVPQAYDLYNLSTSVWEFDDRDVPYTIADGQTPYFDFKSRNLITPVINPPASASKLSLTLFNLHSLRPAAIAMDDVLSCTEEGHELCSSLSDYLIGTKFAGVSGTNIYTPVFGKSETSGAKNVVGFTTVGFNWQKELQRLIVDEPSYDGLHCVLSAIAQPSDKVTSEYTFLLVDGDAKYIGTGNQHESSHSDMAVEIPLSLIGSRAHLSVHYRLVIYPTRAYENSHYTNTPYYTAIGFASMILFTSLIFFLYDYLMNENVKEKDLVLRIKRDFVRFISHEIRTPLNTVSVGLQLIFENLVAQQGGEALADDMMELTMDVQSSTATAVSVLNDLLNFDKLEAGELEIAHEPVFIWDIVSMVVRSFKIPVNQKNISIDLAFTNMFDEEVMNPKQLMLMGDKFKICHIIRNMMSNALKFTDEGGSITILVVRAKSVPIVDVATVAKRGNKVVPELDKDLPVETDQTVTISVTDTGHGLTPVQIGMLFRDGVQFNPNELQAGQGSGLGLYLSQALAALHGGKMWATSEGEGCGATFTVQFPVTMALETDESAALGLVDNSVSQVKMAQISFEHTERTKILDMSPRMRLDSFRSDSSLIHSTLSTDKSAPGLDRILISSLESTRLTAKSDHSKLAHNGDFVFNSLNSALNVSILNREARLPKCSPGRVFVESVARSSVSPKSDTPPIVMPSRIKSPPPSATETRILGRVLVVDDACSNRKIVCKMLQKRGYACVQAQDGKECLDIVFAASSADFFDCILMDFQMPVLNGPDATTALRKAGYSLPIFGLTGNVMPAEIEHFLRCGADHVLPKPFLVSDFTALYEKTTRKRNKAT
jgi:signal transduction histidine kinase/CheY-like chemotaxis protein